MLVSYPIPCVPCIVLVDPTFSFLVFLLSLFFLSQLVIFASFSRGQPPARHTKVVDDDLRPLKSSQTHLSVPFCVNDATSPNPTTPGSVRLVFFYISSSDWL